jgi:hypothetical protein
LKADKSDKATQTTGARMPRHFYITLGLLLCGTSALGADTSEPAPSKTSAMTRMETLASRLFTTVKDLTDDVVPLVKAADEELAREWRAEWPTIQEEIRQQFTALLPGKTKTDSRR